MVEQFFVELLGEHLAAILCFVLAAPLMASVVVFALRKISAFMDERIEKKYKK